MSTNDPSSQIPGQPGQPIPPVEAKKSNGKKYALIVVAAVVVLALIGAAFFVLRPSSSDEASGEVFLEAAASQGQDSFSDGPLADQPDPAIAQPATQTAPTVTGTVSAVSTSGGEPGLYGGSQSSAICDTVKMINFLQTNPSKAQAWVDVLNSDSTLRWQGGTLTTADIPAYIGGLTPILLVQDTRVTNHGYTNGKPTSFQSVLQRGSGVFVDVYGVPRVRCYCGNPLMAPQPTNTTPKYKGSAWPGFNPSQIGVVKAVSTPLTAFSVRIPATPNGAITPVKIGPKCGPQTACPPSLFAAGNNSSPSASTSTSPSASGSTAPSPSSSTVYNPQLSTAAANRLPNGDVNYSVSLTGYPPNSKVSLTCGSSKQKSFYTTTITTNAQGQFAKSPFCYTPDPGFFIRDNTNNITARP